MLRFARFVLSRQLGPGHDNRPTKRQKRLALGVAALGDLVQLALAPVFAEGALSPFDWAIDVVMAGALILTLGWRWRTALALGMELVPGLALFPTWTAVIAMMPTEPEPAAVPVALPAGGGKLT
jgi:hypothetical protein